MHLPSTQAGNVIVHRRTAQRSSSSRQTPFLRSPLSGRCRDEATSSKSAIIQSIPLDSHFILCHWLTATLHLHHISASILRSNHWKLTALSRRAIPYRHHQNESSHPARQVVLALIRIELHQSGSVLLPLPSRDRSKVYFGAGLVSAVDRPS